MKRVFFLVGVLPFACMVAAAGDWARPDLIAKVASGEIREARVSWWGFDAKNSTKYLKAAIASGVPKLTVDKMPSPWISTPLRAVSNQHIVFEDGSVLLAKRGEFSGINDRLLSLIAVENVRITGYGAKLRMWRCDYDGGKDKKGRKYERAEWRHALSMHSATNVVVEGLTFEESGGDGIYIASRGTEPCRNITIRDCVCDGNYRQGLSIISAENLLVETCVFRNTNGAAPEDGVDFEPNKPTDRFVNCVLRNCVSENNAGNGFEFALSQSRNTTVPCSIRLENCRTSGDGIGIKVRTRCRAADGDYPTGAIDFRNCTVSKCRYEAVEIMQNPVNALKVKLQDCVFEDVATENPDAPAVVLTSPFPNDPKPAMPEMSNLKWIGRGSRELSKYDTMNFSAIGEEALAVRRVETADAEIVDMKPGSPVSVSSPCFRRHLRLVAYAGSARRIAIWGNHRRVGSALPAKKPVSVTDVSGSEIASIPLDGFGVCDLSFDAPSAGFYILQLDLGGHAFAVDKTDTPLASDCSPWTYKKHPCPQGMIASEGSLFVPVKAGCRAEFRAGGSRMREKVALAVFDPSGKLAFCNPAVHCWEHFLAPPSGADGLWRLEFAAPSNGDFDDFSVMIAGVQPLVFFSPEKFWYSK